MPKPNHICKTCGVPYYACNDCDKKNSWRAVGCCFEHAEAYWRLVEADRAKKVEQNIPEQSESQPEKDEGIDN